MIRNHPTCFFWSNIPGTMSLFFYIYVCTLFTRVERQRVEIWVRQGQKYNNNTRFPSGPKKNKQHRNKAIWLADSLIVLAPADN